MAPLRWLISVDRAPSIRQLTLGALALFALVTVALGGAMLWSAAQFHDSMESMLRDARSEAIARELEVAVLTYQRVSNLYVLSREARAAEERQALAARMGELLREAGRHVGLDGERRLVARIESDLGRYLDERLRNERRGLRLSEVVAATRPALGPVLMGVEALRELNSEEVAQARQRALTVDRIASIVGIAGCAVLLLGWLAIALGVRRYLVAPIMDLHQVMGRFSRGDAEVRDRVGGVREVAELGEMFNDMASSLARQRQEQLTFLAGIAHDLRNPLAGLKLGIHALEQDQSEVRRSATRRRLERQVDFLSRMVDDLLDATRIEAGELEIRRKAFDARDLVTDMVDLYRTMAPDRQIQGDVPGQPVMVEGDPLRLEQVASNLFSNAIKFSPPGSPVRGAVTAEAGEAVLCVTDRGMGIPAEDRESIFAPFRRRSPEAAPGAGLGLSVVRRIVQAHGGRVEVESEPGVGSTFRVRLPLALETPEAPGPVRARPPELE